MNCLSEMYEKNKKQLWFAVLSTYIWGLSAHGYAFFNNLVSHDSLNEFNAKVFGNVHKIQLGRIFVPTYREFLRCDITIPWLIGLLSLLWIGLAVFLVIRIFQIESRTVMALTAGVFVANITVSATAATYIHDLDCNMFAVLCAVAAVFLWRKVSWGWLGGAIFVAGALGIYQSLVFVTVALAMMVCILDILDGRSFSQVLGTGMKAIGMILLGGAVYLLVLKLQLYRSGLTMYSNGFNSLDTITSLSVGSIPSLLADMYRLFLDRVWNVYSVYPASMVHGANLVLALVCGVALTVGLFRKTVSLWSKALCLVLIALLPTGMTMVYILSNGYVHEVMLYAVWLVYLLPLLLSRWLAKRWQEGALHWAGLIQQGMCFLMLTLILYGNVQFSNTMYLKKEIERNTYLQLMGQISTEMLETEDYVPGQTPVIFVGLPGREPVVNSVVPGFEQQSAIVGMQSPDIIYMPEMSRYQAYFDYILNVPLCLPDGQVWHKTVHGGLAAQMPSYPEDGYIAMHDGMLIVKLGPVERLY